MINTEHFSFPWWIWIFILGGVFVTWWTIANLQKDTPYSNKKKPIVSINLNSLQTVLMVTQSEIQAELIKRRKHWHDWSERINQRLGQLETRKYESMSPEQILTEGTSEELANFAVIIGQPNSVNVKSLVEALRKSGSHSLASLFRGGHVNYDEVVSDVAVKLGASRPSLGTPVVTIERTAIAAALKNILATAKPEQRQAIIDELARNNTSGLLTTTGAIVVANLSGFGLYIAASTSLAAVTSAIGLTLPFAIYTGMSSVLATVTGPIGWAVLATWAVIKLGSADHKATIPGVIAIATVRSRLIAERDQEINSLMKEKNSDLANALVRLNELDNFVKRIEQFGPNYSLPKSSVPW